MTNPPETTNYDAIAEKYIGHTERPDSWNNLYERPSMLALLPPLKGKNVLDLGCSSGFYTEYALNNGADVTAVDISRVLLVQLSLRIKSPRLKVVCADINQPLTFADAGSFDCVICSLVLHYLKEWEPLLAELYRVMKKDGELYISTHHPYLVLDYPPQKGTNYFDTVFVKDTWGREARSFDVHYYTRSLTSTLKPIIESPFHIVKIEEPLPDDNCKQVSPRVYQRLREKPGFLFIVLRK